MKNIVLSVLVCVAALGAACASLNVTAERLTHTAIVQSENLHAGGVLNDADFQKTNLELNHIAVAGREYTKLVIAKQAGSTDVLTFLRVVQQEIATLRSASFGGVIQSVLDNLTKLEAKLLGAAPPA